MNNITYSQDKCKEETASTWLIAVMQFGLKINFFESFENFRFKMRKVKYLVCQKLVVTIISTVIGCEAIKDINEKLGIEKLAANMFGMDTVPDQSQINLLLIRMNSKSINQ